MKRKWPYVGSSNWHLGVEHQDQLNGVADNRRGEAIVSVRRCANRDKLASDSKSAVTCADVGTPPGNASWTCAF